MKDLPQDLIDAFERNTNKIQVKQLVNWNHDNTFNADEVIENELKSARISKKSEGDFGVNVIDKATSTMNNTNNNFSPKNTSGKWSGDVVPRRYTEIVAGLDDDSLSQKEVTIFSGVLSGIVPSYKNNKVTLKSKDKIQVLKNKNCPDKFYYDYKISEIIKDFLKISLVPYTPDTIDDISSRINADFSGMKMWKAIKKMSSAVWAKVYMENGYFHFHTKLSPDYIQEPSSVYTFNDGDYFEIKEKYTDKDIFNEVSIDAKPLVKAPKQIIWTGAQKQNEIEETYTASDIGKDVGSVVTNSNQLQLSYMPEPEGASEQPTKNVPIQSLSLTDTSTRITYETAKGQEVDNWNSWLSPKNDKQFALRLDQANNKFYVSFRNGEDTTSLVDYQVSITVEGTTINSFTNGDGKGSFTAGSSEEPSYVSSIDFDTNEQNNENSQYSDNKIWLNGSHDADSDGGSFTLGLLDNTVNIEIEIRKYATEVNWNVVAGDTHVQTNPYLPRKFTLNHAPDGSHDVIFKGGLSLDNNTGLITFNDTVDYPIPTGDNTKLEVNYTYDFHTLLPEHERNIEVQLDNPAINIEPLHIIGELPDPDMVTTVTHRKTENYKHHNDTGDTKKEKNSFYVAEPHQVDWSYKVWQFGDSTFDQRSSSFYAGKTGYYDVEISLDADVSWFHMNLEWRIIIRDPSGGIVIDKSGTKDDASYDISAEMSISYNQYGLEESSGNPDPNEVLEANLDVDANQKSVGVNIKNNSTDKAVTLKGYANDPKKVEDTLIMMGEPFKRNKRLEWSDRVDNSIKAYGFNSLPPIKNEFLPFNQSKVKELGKFLLDQKSTPKTKLTVSTKPLPQLELGDKVTVQQTDRDIDNDFIIKGITHNFKNSFWDMELKLEQARASTWTYEDDGTPVLEGGDDEEDTTVKPPVVAGLNTTLINASYTGSNKVKISWNKINDNSIDHYNIYCKNDLDSVFSLKYKVDASVTERFDTRLQYNKNYSYKITAVNKHGNESDFSNVVSQTTFSSNTPSVPLFEAETSGYDGNRVNLSWGRIAEDTEKAKKIKYEVRLDKNFGVDDGNLVHKGEENTCIYKLPTSRNLTFHIKAIDASNNNTYSSNVDSISLSNPAPDAPPQPSIKAFFESLWVDISGVSNNDVNGYKVYITDSSGNEEIIDIGTPAKISYKAEVSTQYTVEVSAYDDIGVGGRSNSATATTKTVDDFAKFAAGLRPPTVVDTLPTLPNSSFPVDSAVFNKADKKLYKNVSESWSSNLGENEYHKIMVGTIEAGAVTADQIASDEIYAGHIGTNEIITDTANISTAVILDAYIENLSASQITIGGSTNYESADYDPRTVESRAKSYTDETIKEKMRLKPESAMLWHFDKNITSTDGIVAEII